MEISEVEKATVIKSYSSDYLQGRDAVFGSIANIDMEYILALYKNLLLPEFFACANGMDTEKLLQKFLDELLRMPLVSNQFNGTQPDIIQCILKAIPTLREKVIKDLEAAYEGDPAAYSYHEIVLAYPGLQAIMVQRLAHLMWELKIPVIPRVLTEFVHSKTGIDIHPGAQIGDYFFIDHGTGVVIGETTQIGNHVKIYQGVTLGALSTSGGQVLKAKKRHPTVEDYVTIYAGASILGGKTVIGEGSTIGGNAFITKSVSKNQKIKKDYQGAVWCYTI